MVKRNNPASRSIFRHESFRMTLLTLVVMASPFDLILSAQINPEAGIIHKIDAAVLARSNEIESYSVQEQYSLYRNGETTPSAQETIQTHYTFAAGKTYTPIAQSGSAMLRSAILDKILAGEREMNLPANRETTWITSANYDMHPEPETIATPVQFNGRACLIIDLKAKRKATHLFNGKMWVDAADFSIVHLEGAPTQSPSVFAGDSTITRDYEKIDGYAMAAHAEARAHSFLLGNTVLKIDYTNYQIRRKASLPAP